MRFWVFCDTERESDKSYMINHVVYFGLYHGLLNTWPYMSHLKAEIKRQFFKRTQQNKSGKRVV